MATTGPLPTEDPDALLTCFDATATQVFGWLCRINGHRRAAADSLLADTYLHLSATLDRDLDHALSTALWLSERLPDEQGTALVRTRALADLRFVQRRNDCDIAGIVGVPESEVEAAVIAAAETIGSTALGESVSDVLCRSDRWLDDETRDAARKAIGGASGFDDQGRSGRPDPAQTSRPTSTGRPSRRLMIGAAIGIVILIGAGALWVSSGDTGSASTENSANSVEGDTSATGVKQTSTEDSAESDSSAESDDPNETTSSVTVSESDGSEPVVLPETFELAPGYVADPVPDGFVPSGVFEQLAVPPLEHAGWFQLWAAPGSSRTSGRWFAVLAVQHQSFAGETWSSGVQRMLLDGQEALLRIETDGVLDVRIDRPFLSNPDPSVSPYKSSIGSIRILSFGLSVEELAVISAAVRLDPDSLQRWPDFDSPRDPTTVELLASSGQLDAVRFGMNLLDSAPSMFGTIENEFFGQENRYVTYRSVTDEDPPRTLHVGTFGRSDRTDLLLAFLLPSSTDANAPADPSRTMQVGNRTVTVQTLVNRFSDTEESEHLLHWNHDGDSIIVLGSADLATMLETIASVRQVNAIEWQSLADEANASGAHWISQEFGDNNFTQIGRSELANGSIWTLSISLDLTTANLTETKAAVNDYTSWFAIPFDVDPAQPVSEFTALGSTALVIAMSDPGDATAVRVTVAGSDPVIVALVPINQPGTVAAFHAFNELPPYTVELVDDLGNTLRVLTP